MNFHDTEMGHIFFECQLPQLIQSINALAAALDKPAQQVVLPMEADPEFLSELYHGNYEPETFKQTPESSMYTQAINAAHEELVADLSPESRKKLVKYQDAFAEHNSAEMLRAYESGFRTAVQMMVAGLSQPAVGQSDDAA